MLAATRARIQAPRRSSAQSRTAASSPALAILALVLANVAWGGSAVASKAALDTVPPLTLAVLRVALAYALLRALLARTGSEPATGRGPVLLGFTGVAFFCATQNLGLRHATAGTTALINGAIPVLTLVLAALFLGEQVTGWRLAGLMTSFTGIVLLVLSGSGATTAAAALGNLLPLASAVSFAGYAVLGRRYFGVGGALALVTGSTRYGLLLLLPGAGLEALTSDVAPPGATDWLLVLYLGAGCSALAFVLCGYALARMDAGHAAPFGNLKPLVGVLLAVTLLGEPVAPDQLGGGLLVLLGVGMATMKKRCRNCGTRAHHPDDGTDRRPFSRSG